MVRKTKRRIIYPLAYNPILEYFEKIKSGEIRVCDKVYAVYEELDRLIHDPNSEWEYSPKKANHALEFIENYCKHSKGKMGGKPFIMELWQKALVAAIFGIIHKIDETRKFREIILIIARKNGKSTLASAIGLYLQIADNEPGAEIYAVATKKEQAKGIWTEAKRMVNKSPVLRKRLKPLVGEIKGDFNDSFFKPVASDSDSLDGLNVHGGLLDEIHAWKDKNLYDVIVDGTSAREQPLILITSTAGTVRESVYDMKYEEATKILNGYKDHMYTDETVLPVIYELNNRNDWKNEEAWIEANPGLGTIKRIDQLRTKVNKAKANEQLVKNLLCKDFNIRETNTMAWLTFDDLNNEATYDIFDLKPDYGVGGCDMSQTTDLTCATVLFMVKDDPTIYVMQMYFLPADLLDEKVENDGIRYDLWLDMGLLRLCEGNRINTADVVRWFEEVRDEYGIYVNWTGYDSWSSDLFVHTMKNKFGKESVEPIPQTKKILSDPMHSMKSDLQSNKINYNNNPMLKWCLSNTSIEVDKYGNIQPCKLRNKKLKIDGTASFLDAYVCLERHKEEYMSLVN